MQKKLNQKILSISPSKSIEFAQLASRLTEQGKKVYRFNVGEPDFFPHQNILTATQKGLDQGHVRYSLVPGTIDLRQKISSVDSEKYQIDIKTENIFLANGSKNILYNIFQVICDDRDEVIIPAPYWVSFPEQVKLSGATPIFAQPNQDLSLNFENIKALVNEKTKAIIINFPNNPSGDVPSNEFLNEIINYTLERNIFLILDLAYEETVYSDTRVNLSKLSSIPDNLFIVKSFSKSYAMTGFRLGYCLAPQYILKKMNALQGHLCGNPCTFAQDGALAALNLPDSYLQEIKETFYKKMNKTHSLIKDLFPTLNIPGGGFYLFPNAENILKKMSLTDEQFSLKLLEEKHVALLPGSAFGLNGYLRICYATSFEDIEEGMKRLRDFIS